MEPDGGRVPIRLNTARVTCDSRKNERQQEASCALSREVDAGQENALCRTHAPEGSLGQSSGTVVLVWLGSSMAQLKLRVQGGFLTLTAACGRRSRDVVFGSAGHSDKTGAEHRTRDRDDEEDAHPEQAGDVREAGELVGIRGRAAAAGA